MNRKDIQHFLIFYLCDALYDLAGLFRTVSKVFGYILPIGKYGLILAFLHSCTHELECDILREANQTMGINKPAIQLDKILVTLVKEAGAYMRNEDEIERLSFTEFAKRLKTGEVTGVIIEILRKLIPDKNNSLQFIGVYHFDEPVTQIISRHRKCADLALTCDFENLIHQGMKRNILIRFQFLNDTIYIIAAEKILVAALYIDIKALLVLRIGEITNHRLPERVLALVLYTSRSHRLFDTFLNGKHQIVVAIDIGRAIAVNRQNLAAVLDALQILIQIHIQMIPFKIFPGILFAGVQKLLFR